MHDNEKDVKINNYINNFISNIINNYNVIMKKNENFQNNRNNNKNNFSHRAFTKPLPRRQYSNKQYIIILLLGTLWLSFIWFAWFCFKCIPKQYFIRRESPCIEQMTAFHEIPGTLMGTLAYVFHKDFSKTLVSHFKMLLYEKNFPYGTDEVIANFVKNLEYSEKLSDFPFFHVLPHFFQHMGFLSSNSKKNANSRRNYIRSSYFKEVDNTFLDKI